MPASLFALALPVVAALGRATGWLSSTPVATAIGVVGMLIALAASWFILRGARLTQDPPRDQRPRQDAVGDDRLVRQAAQGRDAHLRDPLRQPHLGCWTIVPVLFGIALAT